jgi:hypothetical protein
MYRILLSIFAILVLYSCREETKDDSILDYTTKIQIVGDTVGTIQIRFSDGNRPINVLKIGQVQETLDRNKI